jgi:lipopolysaccharide transport system permease protein
MSRLWDGAELTYVLARKTFYVRYKRAVIGVIWAVLQPGFQGVVLAVVFSRVIATGSVPHYGEFVLTGIFAWSYFSQSVSAGTVSVLENDSLVKKVALPKVVCPLSSVLATAMASAAAVPVLVVASATAHELSPRILAIPVAMLLGGAIAIGVSLVTSSLFVAYRDVRYIVESALMVGLYVTPVVYSLAQAGPTLASILRWNPVTGVVELYRWCVLGSAVDGTSLAISVGAAVVLLAVGMAVFAARSDEFPDLL